MVKVQRKNEKGNASNFITRTRAIRKLQISLADFRRLCILKGIYPREPKNKKKASGNKNINNTFYYTKDIKFLLHEPLLHKIREHRAFLKKISRAIGKRDFTGVKALQDNEPMYTLDHLVKERYPSFIDALRDMDDCLCHVFLFATMPSTERLPLARIQESQRLAAEFLNYVIKSQCLKKSFLSIKGIYYQVEIMGVPITWLVPYQFAIPVPSDVDFRVMLTFLEFYQTMLGFVNYRLYSGLNLKYPPVLDKRMEEEGGWLNSYVISGVDDDDEPKNDVCPMKLSKKQKKRVKQQLSTLETKIEEIKEETGDESGEKIVNEDDQEEDIFDDNKGIFSSFIVYISREVPRSTVEFVLKSLGATVCYPETMGAGSRFPEEAPQITHQIVDRPLESISIRPGRQYIQPQWAFDCLNANAVLPTDEYAAGKKLPPHLSPFFEYDPTHGMESNEDKEVPEIDIEEMSRKAEMSGKSLTEFEQEISKKNVEKKSKKDDGDKDRIERAKMVMSNKKRRLLESIERRQAKEKSSNKKLADKKRALEKQSE